MIDKKEIKAQAELITGWFPHYDMDTMMKYIELLPPNPFILEIGSFMGRSTFVIASTRDDSLIHAVDPFDCRGYANQGNIQKTEAGEIDCYEEFKKNVLDKFPDSVVDYKRTNKEYYELIANAPIELPQFDLIFLDGDHHPDNVKWEIEHLGINCLKSGGYLLIHDVRDSGYKSLEKYWEQLKIDDRFECIETIGHIGVLRKK